MHKQITALVCAGLSAALFAAVGAAPAFADAVVGVLPPAVGTAPGLGTTDDQFGKEMTVQNWILCTTQANAESIAKARADGVEPALKVYGDLKTNKACGLFPTLKVILRQSLYDSVPGKGHQTHVYRASVNLGTEWPTGFVVSGALAE